MNLHQHNNQILHFSKEFGLITENQIIIDKGIDQNKINIQSIDKVKLIKRRVFYTNSFLFILSILIFLFTYFSYESEKTGMYTTIGFIALVTLIYSIIHKFYLYKIVIKDKNNKIYELKTNQIHRKAIKEFYNKIAKQISK